MYNNINVHLCRHCSNAHDNYDYGVERYGAHVFLPVHKYLAIFRPWDILNAHIIIQASVFKRNKSSHAFHPTFYVHMFGMLMQFHYSNICKRIIFSCRPIVCVTYNPPPPLAFFNSQELRECCFGFFICVRKRESDIKVDVIYGGWGEGGVGAS